MSSARRPRRMSGSLFEEEQRPTVFCRAFDDHGQICRRPALYQDPVRGCWVCSEHAPGMRGKKKQ